MPNASAGASDTAVSAQFDVAQGAECYQWLRAATRDFREEQGCQEAIRRLDVETYELFRSPILECLRRTDGRALALDPQASLGSVHRLLPHVNRVLFARRPGAIAFRTREGRFVSIDDTPTQWFVLSVGP
jgi:hypothetical protein